MQSKNRSFSPRELNLLRSVTAMSWSSRIFVAALAAIFGWGVFAYIYQLNNGLAVTAMREYVSWGLYITNFVFFIGISHVGALMSAILRITHAEWRRPITRMAEVITFSSLIFGALMPIVDLGRPDRIPHLFLYPHISSPIVWDLMCVFTYLTGSTIFLFLPMIPDIALMRDGLPNASWWRRLLYRFLAFGWQGTPTQHARLERAMGTMAIIIIPIAISVHTVVSWIFGMTLRPGWNSTIFGPYFVAGALLSGSAAVIIAMAAFRQFYRLEKYITLQHFRNMAALVLVLDIVYIYFNIAEYVTMSYKMETAERGLLGALLGGEYALAFWLTQLGGLLLPAFLLVLPHLRFVENIRRVPIFRPVPLGLSVAMTGVVVVALNQTATARVGLSIPDPTVSLAIVLMALVGLLIISILPVARAHPVATFTVACSFIVVQAWIKRYLIVVPTLLNPYLPIQNVPNNWVEYFPTWVELSITFGAIAGFVLVYTLFSKVFPIVSIWETREVEESTKEEIAVRHVLPSSAPTN